MDKKIEYLTDGGAMMYSLSLEEKNPVLTEGQIYVIIDAYAKTIIGTKVGEGKNYNDTPFINVDVAEMLNESSVN